MLYWELNVSGTATA